MSKASLDSGVVKSYNLRKRIEAVKNCRNITKKDMKYNDAMPKMKVDPERYVSISSYILLSLVENLGAISDMITLVDCGSRWGGMHRRASRESTTRTVIFRILIKLCCNRNNNYNSFSWMGTKCTNRRSQVPRRRVGCMEHFYNDHYHSEAKKFILLHHFRVSKISIGTRNDLRYRARS